MLLLPLLRYTLLLLLSCSTTDAITKHVLPVRSQSLAQNDDASGFRLWTRGSIHPVLPDLRGVILRAFSGALILDLSAEWVIDLHAFNTLLPIATAASSLTSFYEDIAEKAATTALHVAERYYLRLGEITLEIRSALGAVPWSAVAAYANWMRENTKRGFTGTYVINFVHKPTGKLLTMKLLIGILRWG